MVNHSTQERTHNLQTAFLPADSMKSKGQVQHNMRETLHRIHENSNTTRIHYPFVRLSN